MTQIQSAITKKLSAGIASLVSITIAVMDFIQTIKERRAAKKNSTPDEK
jgi:hypothetical protein